MERGKFAEWYAYHSKINPEWARRVGKVDRTKLDAWARLFIGASLDAAKRASDEMLAGDIKRPFAAEEHVGVIARRARDLTTAAIVSKPVDEESHYCLLCNDTLFVSVLHPLAIQRAQAGEYGPWLAWFEAGQNGRPPARRLWTSAAAFCRCRRAVALREAQESEAKRKGLTPNLPAAYDQKRHIRWITWEKDRSWADTVADLIRSAINLKPANYEPSIAAWNQGQIYDDGEDL